MDNPKDNFYFSKDNTIQCRCCLREITPDEISEDGICDICTLSSESQLNILTYQGGGR